MKPLSRLEVTRGYFCKIYFLFYPNFSVYLMALTLFCRFSAWLMLAVPQWGRTPRQRPGRWEKKKAEFWFGCFTKDLLSQPPSITAGCVTPGWRPENTHSSIRSPEITAASCWFWIHFSLDWFKAIFASRSWISSLKKIGDSVSTPTGRVHHCVCCMKTSTEHD